MQISGFNIGGLVNKDILRQQGMDLTPTTYFAKAFASWSDSDKKIDKSEADISKLKSKYNSANMSDTENVDLLGELVKMGVLTKLEASGIYNGIVPLSPDCIEKGSLTKCESEYQGNNSIRAGNSPDTSDWLSHYQDVFNQVLSNTGSEMKQSNIIKSYEDYLDILARLAVDKNTVTV